MFIVDFFHFLTTVLYCDLTSEKMLFWTSLSFQITLDIKSELPHIYLQTRRIGTGNHQYFCEPKWKWKQTNMHKLIGNACSQTSVSRN